MQTNKLKYIILIILTHLLVKSGKKETRGKNGKRCIKKQTIKVDFSWKKTEF